VPLGNNSIAQATLQWERDFINTDMVYEIPIIQEYRQHTFLAALSSIGGLLAILQGFHLLLFGRPLWWGLFGMHLSLGRPLSFKTVHYRRSKSSQSIRDVRSGIFGYPRENDRALWIYTEPVGRG
jgi:hypothetical protein